MQEELIDVLDENGNNTGKQKPRDQVHKDGDWHRSFHLWIVNGNDVLLQRRSAKKDLEANKIDVTVGGHYSAGEGLEEVLRETEEEIGLFVRPETVSYLGQNRAERVYEEAIDREFQEIYVLEKKQPLDHYYLNCDEVFAIYEVNIDKLINLYQNGGFAAANGWDCQQRVNNALLIEVDLIEQARADTLKTLKLVKEWMLEPKT